MKGIPASSLDACVTDPPYEIGFMGKKWDSSGDAFDPTLWREVYRVLKPGAYLLAFGGTRTYHRMVCAIEDAGFEIRDQIGWAFGSGFPKSHNISKAFDKAAGATREVVRTESKHDIRDDGYHGGGSNRGVVDVEVTLAESDLAKQWDGWGTALKPAWEPIVVARKPLIGTLVENIDAYGVGGINIDDCRVELSDSDPLQNGVKHNGHALDTGGAEGTWGFKAIDREPGIGRWPANIIHDGSEEVLACFPTAKGQQGAITGNEPSSKTNNVYGQFHGRPATTPRIETNTSAARFFYCAKATRADREAGMADDAPKQALNWSNGTKNPGSFQSENTDRSAKNFHPTVKPIKLMRYLCRLVTPPGGTLIDPFAGSGSTGRAANLEGFNSILMEKTQAYADIASQRCGGVRVITVNDELVLT